MQVIRYINGTAIRGELPRLQIENPATVQLLHSLQGRAFPAPQREKKEKLP